MAMTAASSASMAAFIASRQVRRERTTEIIIAVKIFSGRRRSLPVAAPI
jgi:hypothetical protein